MELRLKLKSNEIVIQKRGQRKVGLFYLQLNCHCDLKKLFTPTFGVKQLSSKPSTVVKLLTHIPLNQELVVVKLHPDFLLESEKTPNCIPHHV